LAGYLRKLRSSVLWDDGGYEQEDVASKTRKHEDVSWRVGAAQMKIAQLEAAVKEVFKASAVAP
jgi:hypothetical protein